MKCKILLTIILYTLLPLSFLHAQDLKKQQQAQESAIEQAYKKDKISEQEYYKLLREQQIIKDRMTKAVADGYIDAKEKNAIYGKLQRAEKRLRKYETNREIY